MATKVVNKKLLRNCVKVNEGSGPRQKTETKMKERCFLVLKVLDQNYQYTSHEIIRNGTNISIYNTLRYIKWTLNLLVCAF